MENSPETSKQAPADRRQKREVRRGLTWLWVLLAFVGGLLMPAVVCGGLILAVGVAAGAGGPATVGDLGFGPGVGVIRVEGIITPGGSTGYSTVAGADTIIDLIEQAQDSEDVKAILLRVDSPGGGVVASDEIYHALTQVDKPIVVSMGTTAASGGYYISAPADYIFATPHTLTGSIGVISSFVNAEDLLDDVGVEVVALTTGEFKDTGSFYSELTDEERAYWQAIIDQTYDGFVDVVAEGRGLSEAEVLELADGRVFTGQEALELGLVDEIGYFDDAFAKAAELGGISGEARLIELQPAPTFLDYLAAAQSGQGLLPNVADILELMAQPDLEYRYVGP